MSITSAGLIGKFIFALFSPLSIVFVLSLFLFVRLWRILSVNQVILFVLIFLSLLLSLPVVSLALRENLESIYPPLSAIDYPKADAIVVLGGGISPETYTYNFVNFGSASDRIYFASQLYKAGKSDRILVSGGASADIYSRSEASAMADVLVQLSINQEKLLIESASVNTIENAKFSSRILKLNNIKSILLVTSALHMRRAVAAFRLFDVNVIPAPTDFEVYSNQYYSFLLFMPDPAALDGSVRALKEYIGYRVMMI